jgi:hypothetical protein
MQDVFHLGGRDFVAIAEGTTFEQDSYIMGLVLEKGLDKVIEANGDVAGAVLRSGCVGKFVAGILTDVGAEWTVERALENATHFSNLRDPEGKQVLSACLRGLLKGFFDAGAAFSTASPIASAAPMTSGTSSTKTARTAPSRATPPTRGSATGRKSARRSRTTTTSG